MHILADQGAALRRGLEGEDSFLQAVSIAAGYGKKRVLKGVTVNVARGEIVALIGPNGAGKSTLLKTIFGLISMWEGELFLDGTRVARSDPRLWLRSGVAYVPQGNRIFTDLTVRENLQLGGITLPDKRRLEEGIAGVLSFFPMLKSRLKQRAGTLSGGEKQVLALCNALVLAPRLLLLDEPSLGLAPPLVSHTLAKIKEISHKSGTAVLIVEQKVREVLKIARRVYVLRDGLVSFSGSVDMLNDDNVLRQVYF